MNKFPEELDRGNGFRVIIDRTRLLLALRKTPTEEEIKNLLQGTGFEFEGVHADENNKGTTPTMQQINHTDKRFWIHTSTHAPIDEENLRILREKCGETFDWIGPVYQVPNVKGYDRFVCPVPNVLVIKPSLTFNKEDSELSERLAKYGLKEVTEKSKYLGEYRYYVIQEVENESAYQIRDKLEKDQQLVREVLLESMPMIVPTGLVPNDTLFAQQWNMKKIQAGGPGRTGWDISTGENRVVICVLDEGCDLTHPDLRYFTPGIRLDTMRPDGSPTVTFPIDPMTRLPVRTIWSHGTPCAGIAAAILNNAQGVAGVAGNCSVMPLARVDWDEAEIARGIRFATDNGAGVINMSFGRSPGVWVPTLIDSAIQYAHDHNVVMVSITHNQNEGRIRYPATNPLVIAVGASDQLDNRKTPTSSSGWGSNFGPEISVVAPGVLIPTTDIMGADGYGTGDYHNSFDGTSAAAPHVAGLAALLQSQHTLLRFDSDRVRDIIEQTAEKKGSSGYTYDVSHPNGTWNQEMGYGRINVFRALDFADVYIKDSPLDNGRPPFRAGRFWDNSDIVVRNSDDGKFEHESAVRGRDNYIYVRVTNLGPTTARNVNVRLLAVPFAGTEFVFPEDWTAESEFLRIGGYPTHIEPVRIISHFDSIDPPGFFSDSTAIARFKLTSSQVNTLYGWESERKLHPCLLAQVSSENDYGSASTEMTGMHSWESNNLAQRNVSLAKIIARRPGGSSSRTLFPFLTGNKLNMDLYMEIIIDRSELPKQVELLLNPFDTDEYFPTLQNAKGEQDEETINLHSNTRIKLLDRTRLSLLRSNFKAIMTLEAGSTFEDFGNPGDNNNITIISQQDAEWVTHSGKRLIAIRGDNVTIGVQKQPGELRQMSLSVKIPDDIKTKDHQYQIAVSQRNTKGEVVGGVSLLIESQDY